MNFLIFRRIREENKLYRSSVTYSNTISSNLYTLKDLRIRINCICKQNQIEEINMSLINT